MKTCIYCTEEVQDSALKCKYCGEFFKKKTTADKVAKFLWHSFAIPVFTGIYIAYAWYFIISIKPYNINLTLQPAAEYNYLNANKKNESKNIDRNIPVKILVSQSNKGQLSLGLVNYNTKSLKNATLNIWFPDDIKITDHAGWSGGPSDIYVNFDKSLNQSLEMALQPIGLHFLELNKKYKVFYTITAEDTNFIERSFFIEAYK